MGGGKLRDSSRGSGVGAEAAAALEESKTAPEREAGFASAARRRRRREKAFTLNQALIISGDTLIIVL